MCFPLLSLPILINVTHTHTKRLLCGFCGYGEEYLKYEGILCF